MKLKEWNKKESKAISMLLILKEDQQRAKFLINKIMNNKKKCKKLKRKSLNYSNS